MVSKKLALVDSELGDLLKVLNVQIKKKCVSLFLLFMLLRIKTSIFSIFILAVLKFE